MRDSLLKRGEVIAVVTYADLFQFVIMITGLITICYLIFKDTKNNRPAPTGTVILT